MKPPVCCIKGTNAQGFAHIKTLCLSILCVEFNSSREEKMNHGDGDFDSLFIFNL